jgi:hypothetical protein
LSPVVGGEKATTLYPSGIRPHDPHIQSLPAEMSPIFHAILCRPASLFEVRWDRQIRHFVLCQKPNSRN